VLLLLVCVYAAQAFTKCVVTMNDDPNQPDKTTVAYDMQKFA